MKRNMVVVYVERNGQLVPQVKYVEAEKSNDTLLDRFTRYNRRSKALRQWADHLLETIDAEDEAKKAEEKKE